MFDFVIVSAIVVEDVNLIGTKIHIISIICCFLQEKMQYYAILIGR